MRVVKQGDSWRLAGENAEARAEANPFLEALDARGLSPATVRTYAFGILTLYRWLKRAGLRLVALDQAHLLDFIAFQQDAGAAPKSINDRLTVCALLFRFVTGRDLEAGARSIRPGAHYKGPGRDHALGLHTLRKRGSRRVGVKVPYKLIEPLSAEQVVAFIRSLNRYRDLAIVYLMLFCGLRSREVLCLRIADLDHEHQVLRIQGKGNIERAVPLPHVLPRVIADYLRLERPEDIETDQLFVVLQGRRRGQPMTPSGLRRLFRHRRATRSALANANAHRFRHTFGADMARAGVRLPLLQRMMGHADGKTTLRYINLSMADVAREYRRAIAVIEKRYEPDE